MTDAGSPDSLTLRHDADEQRYVAELDGRRVGLISYTEDGDVVTLPHTEVDDDVAGRGIGSRLVAHALDDVRARSLRVVPSCPFVRAYIDEHPEYADLVAG